jgi:hypothetical protein
LGLRMLPTKMSVKLLFVFLTVAGLASGRNFNLFNNLRYTIWVGILGNDDFEQPEDGGFTLLPANSVSKGLESCGCGAWSANGKRFHCGYWDHQSITIH